MDDKEIVISKVLPPATFSKTAAAKSYDSTTSAPNQWRALPASPLIVYCEESIDLSGYTMQDMTFFPELAFYQSPPLNAIVGEDGGTIIDVLTVSTVPLEMEDMSFLITSSSGPALSEYSLLPNRTPTEWETIPYCRIATYARNDSTPSGAGFMQLVDVGQIGSLQPFAVDKLFIYRMIIPYSNTSVGPDVYDNFTLLQITSCRIGFRGMTKEEPEIEFLMRLKRGYELANQVGQQ